MARANLGAVLLFLVASSARAEEAPPEPLVRGLVSVRLGYGMPFGQFRRANNAEYLVDTISGIVPVQVDAGLRIGVLYGGAYGQLGAAQITACDGSGLSCGGSAMRVGGNAGVIFRTTPKIETWATVGAGYEWLEFEMRGDGGHLLARYQGFEFANAQLGADYRVYRGMWVGPFLAVTLGRYSQLDVTIYGNSATEQIRFPEIHSWATIGVRGRLDLYDLDPPRRR